MLQLFRKTKQAVQQHFEPQVPVSVEVIHREFDEAQDKVLHSCDEYLKNTKFDENKSKIENKADLMKELGFTNSETIEKAKTIEFQKANLKNSIDEKLKLVQVMQYYIQKYPLNKFIPVSELNRICKQYGLIHAPVANYIKDVPEKNLLEISNRKRLDYTDSHEDFYQISFSLRGNKRDSDQYYIQSELPKSVFQFKHDVNTSRHLSDPFWRKRAIEEHLSKLGYNKKSIYIDESTVNRVSMNGLFVAAPISHFKLDDVNKQSEFGYYTTTKVAEVKDPIVFEYVKHDLVRIISKWGTDDDQAYLDDTLTNSIEN